MLTQSPNRFFSQLPSEAIKLIYENFQLDDIPSVTVNKESKKYINEIWKSNLRKIFPHVYTTLFAKEKTQSKFHYQKTFHLEYSELTIPNKLLFNLVKYGDLNKIKKIKIEFSDLCLSDAYGCPLIEWAVKNSHQELLNYFFEHIILPYSPSYSQWSKEESYWRTVCRQSEMTALSLIEKGEKIAIESLINAAFYGTHTLFIELFKLYVTPGKESQINKLLEILAVKNRCQSMNVLIKEGIDINITLSLSQGLPLNAAVDNDHINMVTLLLSNGSKILAKPLYTKNTILGRVKSTQIFVTLVKFGAAKTISINSSLLFSDLIREDRKEEIKILLDSEDVSNEIKNKWYQQVFNSCLDNTKSLDILELFLKRKYNPNTSFTESSLSLLHLAIFRGHYQLIEMLVKYNANVNLSTDLIPKTPLYMLIKAQKEDELTKLISLFLAHNANIYFIENNGMSSYNLVTQNKNISEADAKLYQIFECEHQLREAIKLLSDQFKPKKWHFFNRFSTEATLKEHVNNLLLEIKKKYPSNFAARFDGFLSVENRLDPISLARLKSLPISKAYRRYKMEVELEMKSSLDRNNGM